MTAGALRTIMHLGGLAIAALLFVLLPFSPLVNGAIAILFWIQDGIVAEWIYNRRASTEEKVKDLRDRVDNPPL